jgi:hypothetical protein
MVHTAAGVDSLQALHIALAMMAVQVEGYQQEHGRTLYGDPELLLMKPDIDSLTSGLEARPDYPQWRPAR